MDPSGVKMSADILQIRGERWYDRNLVARPVEVESNDDGSITVQASYQWVMERLTSMGWHVEKMHAFHAFVFILLTKGQDTLEVNGDYSVTTVAPLLDIGSDHTKDR
jgi:hypothetical protein